MIKNVLLILSFLSLPLIITAQLPDGSTAPDFTAIDIYGDTHHLDEYLDEGYTVILKFSATWCGICWNYHNSGALTQTWEQYGPTGTNEAVILFIEGDIQTSIDCLYGNCQGTQGNWTMMTPYPIINSHLMNEPYEISGYPTVIGIHPNGKTRSLGQATADALGEFIMEARHLGYSSSISNITCLGANDASIALIMENDTILYSYLWNTGSTDSIISNLSPGIYRATISDGAGTMIITEDFVISEPDPLIINTMYIHHITCTNTIGNAAVEAVGGNGGYEYVWSNGQNGNQLVAFNPGSYGITVTDSLGCLAIEEIGIFRNNEAPAIDAGEDQVVACDVDWPIELQSHTNNNNLLYLWSHEDGPLADNADQAFVWVERTGMYRVSVIDTSTGCMNYDEVLVSYETIAESFKHSEVKCVGSETGWIELNYETSIPHEILWSNGFTGNRLENLKAGNYTALTSIGECQKSFSLRIKEPTFELEVELETLLISAGKEGVIEVSVSGGWGDYLIEWFYEGNLFASNEIVMIVDQTGEYEVRVEDDGGCVITKTVYMDFTTSVLTSTSNESINIYPNPVLHTLNLDGLNEGKISEIEIFDSSGKNTSISFNTNSSINVSNLSSGQYYLRILYKDGKTSLRKFVKL